MLSRSRTPCKSCTKERRRCGRERPTCESCAALQITCKYDLPLQWGGRPYRDINKKVKIPKDSVMENGVLKVKKWKKFATTSKSQRLKLVKEKLLDERPEQEEEVLRSETANFTEQVEKQERIYPPLQENIQAMDFVRSSTQYWDHLEFFINKTSQVLVAIAGGERGGHPFRTTVPQLAVHSVTLMKILIAFGAQHKYQLTKIEVSSQLCGTEPMKSLDESYVSRLLLRQVVQELVQKMESPNVSTVQSDCELMLASILMLAGYSIFFGGRRIKWSGHLRGARDILRKMLPSQSPDQRLVVVSYTSDQNPRSFLFRWFAFITIMGLLSSAPLAYSDDLIIDFSKFFRNKDQKADIGAFDNVEYNNGMETKVLIMLNKLGSLIIREEKNSLRNCNGRLLSDAIELDYEITKYLENLENQRSTFLGDESESDKLLRALSELFALSGLLQLRRRVMGLPVGCKLVKDLLLQATQILESKIPTGSTTLCSIMFCVFTCGCECVSEDLKHLRPLYANKLDQIVELGLSSTSEAKNVMEECWRTGKNWWEVYKQLGVDLSFSL